MRWGGCNGNLPADFALPNDLIAGPDGAMWVTDSSLGKIWRIAKSGKIRSYELGDMPGGITTAYGSMWVADSGGDAIHRVETDGSATTYPLPAGAFPIDIVKGSDGALWFTEGRVGAGARHTVAAFTDADPNARARDYAVTISWGDGSTDGGWVRRADDGSFAVRGRHTYEKQGTRRVVVRITDGVGRGLDAKVTSTAVVSR